MLAKPIRVPRRIILPKDRVDDKIQPPYIANEKEFMKLVVSLRAMNGLITMIENDVYHSQRARMLKYLRARLGRLRYNIDQFLRTYSEKDKL